MRSPANNGYLILVITKQVPAIFRVPLLPFGTPASIGPKQMSSRSMSLTFSEELSNSLQIEEAWVLFELGQAGCIHTDTWESAVIGSLTFLKKRNADYTRLLSKAQTTTIICADLRDAMAVVRQRECSAPDREFLWSRSINRAWYITMDDDLPCKSPPSDTARSCLSSSLLS